MSLDATTNETGSEGKRGGLDGIEFHFELLRLRLDVCRRSFRILFGFEDGEYSSLDSKESLPRVLLYREYFFFSVRSFRILFGFENTLLLIRRKVFLVLFFFFSMRSFRILFGFEDALFLILRFIISCESIFFFGAIVSNLFGFENILLLIRRKVFLVLFIFFFSAIVSNFI